MPYSFIYSIKESNKMETKVFEIDGLDFDENVNRPTDTHAAEISSLVTALNIFAWISLFLGLFFSFYLGFTDTSYYSGRISYFELDGDFNAGVFFFCLISSMLSFCLILGFAKIVEAADKYLKQ